MQRFFNTYRCIFLKVISKRSSIQDGDISTLAFNDELFDQPSHAPTEFIFSCLGKEDQGNQREV